MHTILVSGVGGPAGRAVSDLLIARGLRVVGTDMRTVDFPGEAFFQVPPSLDESYLPVMQNLAARTGAALFIPTVSEELPLVAARWQGIPAVISDAAAVEIANDKYRTALALAEHGVAVPRFALPSQFSSARELSERIGWPCITKPRVGRGGREVRVRYEADWPLIELLDDSSIIQEFAGGIDYAPNVFFDPAGEKIAVVLEKTELKEGLVGNARSVARVDDPRVAETALAAVRAVGLVGPQDVDIRKRADGTPVVLEINARFGANTRHAPEILEATLRMHRITS